MGSWGCGVRAGLPVVAVFEFVLDVLMIMQYVRVRMRHIPVRVFVRASWSFCSVPGRIYSARSPNRIRIERASLTDATCLARATGNSFLSRN
jgi:hypothetical protein